MAQKPIDGTQLDNTTVDAATVGGFSIGLGANDIVQLDAFGKLPAVNGLALTEIPYKNLDNTIVLGTAIVLSLIDPGRYIRMASASPSTVTVPPESSVPWEQGSEIIISRDGTGSTTIVPGAGVTVNTSGTLVISDQHDTVTLVKTGTTDVWDLRGDTTPHIIVTGTLVAPFAVTGTETEVEWTHGLGTDDIDYGFTVTGSVDPEDVSVAAVSSDGYYLTVRSPVFNNNFIAAPTAPTTGKIKFRFKNNGTDQTATIRAWARKR